MCICAQKVHKSELGVASNGFKEERIVGEMRMPVFETRKYHTNVPDVVLGVCAHDLHTNSG